ncbi:hypothetical protein GJ744_000679 [Endocarpon pusillum]|uniref:Metallo-beta-lactamase domain-containing protein n=1 Tax=Endocarpon pusillum TaxID=364733 RepID=A0A8H7AD30_9EURO|nr:hypothetical protein GJ744_000679 [Endocarpon pusillum]
MLLNKLNATAPRQAREDQQSLQYLAMSTYITIKNVPQERWLAQVTMIDAAVGDCNIIDLIVHGDNQKWSSSPHRRVVIDTGISYFSQAKSPITAAILDALLRRSLPVYQDAVGNIPQPAVPVPLNIHEVQITHADIDHIGNAGELMEELVTRNMLGTQLKPTTLRYSYVPPASPTLTFSLAGAILDPSDKQFFIMSWKVGGLYQWETEIKGLGLSVFWVPSFFGWWGIPYEEVKDDNTEERFILFKVPTTGLTNDAQKPAKFAVELDLFVREPLTEEDTTEFLAGYYGFQFDVDLILAWLRNLLAPTQHARPQGGIPLQTVEPDFKTTHAALAKLNPFRFNYPGVIEWTPPRDEQVVMRFRQPGAHEPDTETTDLVQMIVSPTVPTSKALGRYEVTNFLREKMKLDDDVDEDVFDDDRRGLYADESIANRASVVTWFRREELGFDMLFTGDAYDQESDIRDALARIKYLTPANMTFSVLKVPHHGSNTTTHSRFYQQVRAYVYLICGRYLTHGNPRFSSLRAIIEGFRGKPRPGGQPFRLYFSDPDIQKDAPGSKGLYKHSPVKKILQLDLLKPNKLGGLDYEMYRLRPPPRTNPVRKSYGSILFWSDVQGNVMDTPHPDEWDLCHL